MAGLAPLPQELIQVIIRAIEAIPGYGPEMLQAVTAGIAALPEITLDAVAGVLIDAGIPSAIAYVAAGLIVAGAA